MQRERQREKGTDRESAGGERKEEDVCVRKEIENKRTHRTLHQPTPPSQQHPAQQRDSDGPGREHSTPQHSAPQRGPQTSYCQPSQCQQAAAARPPAPHRVTRAAAMRRPPALPWYSVFAGAGQ